MICVKCRKEIPDGSVYCNFCGHKQSTPLKPKPLKRANGMGNVTKLQDRRRRPWRARMTVNGRQVIVGHYERKTDALAALERITLSGGLPQFFGITVAEVRNQWMEKHYPSIGSSGVGSYETAWEYFPAELRNMKMENVKTAHLQSVIDMAVEMGKSQSTCEKIKQLESQLCKWAMENDIINKNYAQFVKINAKKPDPREPFTKQELLRIFAYFKKTRDRVAAAVLLLCHTGLRPNEFLSLKKDDYYNGCLHGGSKTEKGMNRSVPVPTAMLPLLAFLMASDSEYIYPSREGKPYAEKNWRTRNYYPMLKAAGFTAEEIEKRPPYSCRHTYATMCAKAKMDEKALQDILGHEDITTTMNVYTHTDEEYLKQAALGLNFLK